MTWYQLGDCPIESRLDCLGFDVVCKLKDKLRNIKCEVFHYYMCSYRLKTPFSPLEFTCSA